MDATNSIHGRVTDSIMRGVRERLPDLSTHEYNRIWEAVFHNLDRTEGVTIVPDNDWAVAAKFSNLPMKRKRAILAMMNELLKDTP